MRNDSQAQAASNEAEAALSRLDEQIAKLKQVRELLADTTVLAVVNEALGNVLVNGATTATRTRRVPKGHRYRGSVEAAYEYVQTFGDQPFTKRELANKLRAGGHEVRKHRHAVYYAVEKLKKDGVIELVERGGGKRPNKYQRVQTNRAEPNRDAAQIEGSMPSSEPITLSEGRQFRNTLVKTAFQCIQQFNRPFAAHELIQRITEAGFTFVANPDVSIAPVLTKLVKDGFLVVIREQSGDQRALYERRHTE